MRARFLPSAWVASVLSLGALFAWLQFGNLAYPLLWQDELQTVTLGRQVLRHGYPKVHEGELNLFDLRSPMERGIDAESDAFVATPWFQFYFAVPGIALAEGVEGDYDRTRVVRLPFALTGTLGVLLFLVTLRRLAGRARAPLTLAFLACACVSIVLMLHVREARYYALTVLQLAALFYLHVQHRILARLSFAAWAAGTTALLVLIFHTFTPLFASALVATLADAVLDTRTGWRARVARTGVPLVATGIALAATYWLYPLFELTRAWALKSSSGHYLTHLGFNLSYLAKHEFALAALLAAGLWAVARRRVGMGPSEPALSCAARYLALLSGLHCLAASATPLLYERYVVMLSPAITVLFLLLTLMLVRSLRTASPWLRWGMLGTLAALVAFNVAQRAPELRGRLQEVREPFRGPLDVVVERIRELYQDPAELLIATNYESAAFLYYLNCRIVVGWAGRKGLPAPGELPDVVVPRSFRGPELPSLDAIVSSGKYRRQTLPIADLPANNLPTVCNPSPWWRHHYVTPVSLPGFPSLVWHYRLGDAGER